LNSKITTIREVAPDGALFRLLPGARFADAFSVVAHDLDDDAAMIAERVLGRRPRWVGVLMGVRNVVVSPFGLRTPKMRRNETASIGVFPIIEKSRDLIVLGFDDAHLDFRVIVEVGMVTDNQRRVILTTLVRTNNRFGAVYLCAVKPFHRLIVRTLLAQV
jgi:Protein of unknown function (DUF2867)